MNKGLRQKAKRDLAMSLALAKRPGRQTPRGGAGKHDPRPKRLRTREACRRAWQGE